MISNEEIQGLYKEILDIEGKNYRLVAAVLVGSSLYPQFINNHSDIDLIFIVENEFPKSLPINIKGIVTNSNLNKIIEYQLYNEQSFIEDLRFGELIVSFTIILGYEILFGSNDCFTTYHELSLSRFNNIFSKFLLDNSGFLFETEWIRLQTFLAETILSLDNERINSNVIHSIIKRTYILKCIIINCYRFVLLWKTSKKVEIPFMHKVSFILINEERSYRLFDYQKYKMDDTIEELVSRINSYLACKNEMLSIENLNHILFNIAVPIVDSTLSINTSKFD